MKYSSRVQGARRLASSKTSFKRAYAINTTLKKANFTTMHIFAWTLSDNNLAAHLHLY